MHLSVFFHVRDPSRGHKFHYGLALNAFLIKTHPPRMAENKTRRSAAQQAPTKPSVPKTKHDNQRMAEEIKQIKNNPLHKRKLKAACPQK